jgi:two-component system, sensor histidine kinase LadS
MLKIKFIILIQLFYVFIWIKTLYPDINVERKIFLNDSMDNYSVGLILDYLEDKENKLNIRNILTDEYENKKLNWIKSETKSLAFGFTSSSYWVRFVTANSYKKEINWSLELDYPHINSIELYKSSGKDRIEMKKAGNSLPFKERDLFYRNFIFNQIQQPETQSTYYMHFNTAGSMNIPLWAWSPNLLMRKINNELILFGMYYGILMLVSLFTLLSFLSSRNKAYLYFCLWIIGFSLYQLSVNGLSFQYFWPDSAKWERFSIPFFIILAIVCGLQYGRSFLNLKNNLPMEDKIVKSLILVSIVGMICVFIFRFPVIIIIVFFIIIYVIRLISITKSITRYNPLLATRYYIAAWIVLIIGVSVFTLKSMGLLPSNFITNWSQQIGSILHVILLGIAIAENFNIVSKEKENAQIQVIEAFKTAALQKDEFLEQASRKNIEIEKLNTELKKHITDLDEANKRITISEEKYRILVEGSNDIIFSLDKDFKFLTVNNRINTHLNIKPDEIIAKYFFDIIHEGSERVSVLKQVVQEKLELFAVDKKPISFKTDFKVSFTSEPKEMRIYLEYVNIEGRNEIIGKATRVEDDMLIKYMVSEKQCLSIDNYFITAEDISHRITRNLIKYMDHKKVYILRIGLREIIINAIEHGNFNISFEDKSELMNDNNYFMFIAERQQDPKYRNRRVQIEYSIDSQKAVYQVTDEGNGFDHEKILKGDYINVNKEMLAHGRGITMAKNYFDEINFNDKGNQVTLVKYLI